MPRGFQMTFLTPVPKGHATIGQRFNAGCRCRAGRVPKGRMKNNLLDRPFGTQGCPTAIPALKRWAILVSSLRDEGAHILVALGEDARATLTKYRLLFLFCISRALCGEAVRADSPQSDVIVVGAGISGLCAALEGARRGANVTVIDMGSVFGGHAVMSSGMVCMVGTPEQQHSHVADSEELAFQDFVRLGEDANPDWARFYAQNSRRDVYDWLHGLGVTDWELYPLLIPGNSVRRQHVAKGRGIGLVSPIYRDCLRCPNLHFVWNTKVTGLIIESQRVAGVRGIHQRSRKTEEFRAGDTVLATGGFESNLELVRACWPHYFPALTSGTRILLGSGINAVGSGLELAGRAGGALARLDHQLFYSTGLVDPRDPTGWRGLHAFNRAAIWVNVQAERFVWDGAPDPKNQMPAVLRQTPPTYWAIFDANSRQEFFVSGSDWNDSNVVQQEIFANPKLAKWVKQADTIEALARAAGLPAATLARTVKRWNQMVDRGVDTDFHRFEISSQERPLKIETPPFFALQFFPLSRKSLGGVAVDLSCRVLDQQGRPIQGLYAVGELAGVGGINGQAALEGTMLGPSILMGRVAAKHIAERIQHHLNPSPKAEAERLPLANSHRTDPETLRAWREVLRQLVAQPRLGYLHFEKVHTVVMDRNYDCARCHDETSPLALTEDQLDRRALVQACPVCHGGVKE
jgi:predicted oxidoreductase